MLLIVPDWAPNLHPLIVHFPIALLFGAVLLDMVAVFARRSKGLHVATVVMYVLGTLGVVAAYLTGQEAVDTVTIPSEALSTMTSHENWALATLIFFAAYSIIRLVILFVEPVRYFLVRGVLVVIALIGLYLVWHTGEQGGKLVFEHGVGVGPVAELTAEIEELRARERALAAEGAAPVVEEDGSWSWFISDGAEMALVEAFTWKEGDAENVEAEVIETDGRRALSVQANDEPLLFATGDPIRSVQIDALLNADDFDGRVMLVHNVIDDQTYHYLALDGDRIVQGRVVDGEDEELDSGTREASGWIMLRASGDAGHFYGYENGRTVTHGHSPTPEAGVAGLRIEGNGTLLIERVEVQVVD